MVYEPRDLDNYIPYSYREQGHEEEYPEDRILTMKIHHMQDINGEHALIEPAIDFNDLPGYFYFANKVEEFKGPNIYNDAIERAALSFLHRRVPPPDRMFLLETFKPYGITSVNDWIGMMKVNGGRALGDHYTVKVLDGREPGDTNDYWSYLNKQESDNYE